MSEQPEPESSAEKVVPPPPDVDKKYIVDIFEGVRQRPAPTPHEKGDRNSR